MNKNDDRIWDVLIEDALRDSTEEQPRPMHERGDRTRRLLSPLGRPGVDRGRSMIRRRPRKRWVPVAIGAAVCVLLAAILWSGALILPKLGEPEKPTQPDGQTADGTSEEPATPGGTNQPESNQQPVTPPDNEPVETPEPEDQPEEAPEETPEPEPEPEQPDEQVETPEETPGQPPEEQPEPTPEPQPDKPKDVVKEPEETTTTPEAQPERGPRIQLLQVDEHAELQISADGETWLEAGDAPDFDNARWFKSRKPVDLLAGGVLLRLEGEARVTIGESDLALELRDDDLFVDSRGAGRPVSISVSEQTLGLASGAVLLEQGTLGTDISVFDGEVSLGDETIPAGMKGTLKKRGLSDVTELREKLDEHDFLAGLGGRVVYREDFEFGPVLKPDANLEQGRLRKGRIEDGLLHGAEVFWGYPENVPVETGLVLRIRVRFSNAEGVTLNQFCEERNDNYSFELKAPRNGEWYVLEIPVADFRERTTHTGAPQEGESFQNVSLHPSGEQPAVAVDWVELIRGR